MAAGNACAFLTKSERDVILEVLTKKHINVYTKKGSKEILLQKALGGSRITGEIFLESLMLVYMNSKDNAKYILCRNKDDEDSKSYLYNILSSLVDSKFKHKYDDNDEYSNVVYIPDNLVKDVLEAINMIRDYFDDKASEDGTISQGDFYRLVNRINAGLVEGGLTMNYIINSAVLFVNVDGRYCAIIRNILSDKNNKEQLEFNNISSNLEIIKTFKALTKYFDRQSRETRFSWDTHTYSIMDGYTVEGPHWTKVLGSASLYARKNPEEKRKSKDYALWAPFGNAFDNVARELFMKLNSFLGDSNSLNVSVFGNISIDQYLSIKDGLLLFQNMDLLHQKICEALSEFLKTTKVKEFRKYKAYKFYVDNVLHSSDSEMTEEKFIENASKDGSGYTEEQAYEAIEAFHERPNDWVNVFDMNIKDDVKDLDFIGLSDKLISFELGKLFNQQVENTASLILNLYRSIKLKMFDLTGDHECVFMSGIYNKEDGTIQDLPACTGIIYGKDDIVGRYVGGTFDMIVIDSNGVPHIFDFKTESLPNFQYDENGHVIFSSNDPLMSIIARSNLDKYQLHIQNDYNTESSHNKISYINLLNFYHSMLATDPNVAERMDYYNEETNSGYSTTLNLLYAGVRRGVDTTNGHVANYELLATEAMEDATCYYTKSYILSQESQKDGFKGFSDMEDGVYYRTNDFIGFEPRVYDESTGLYDNNQKEENKYKEILDVSQRYPFTGEVNGEKAESRRHDKSDLTRGKIDNFKKSMDSHNLEHPVVAATEFAAAKTILRERHITPEASVAISKMIAYAFSAKVDEIEKLLIKKNRSWEKHEEYTGEDGTVKIKFYTDNNDKNELSDDDVLKIQKIFNTSKALSAFRYCNDRMSMISGGANDKKNKGSILRSFIFEEVRKELHDIIMNAIANREQKIDDYVDWYKNNFYTNPDENMSESERERITSAGIGEDLFNVISETDNNGEALRYLDLFDDGSVVFEYLKYMSYRKIGQLENISLSRTTKLPTEQNGSTEYARSVNAEMDNIDNIFTDDANAIERSGIQWGVGNEEKNMRDGLSARVKRRLESIHASISADEIIRNPILYFLKSEKTCDASKLTETLIRHLAKCGTKIEMVNKIRELGKSGLMDAVTANELVDILDDNSIHFDSEFSTEFFCAFRKHQSIYTEVVNEFNPVTGQMETYVRIANMSSGSSDIMNDIKKNSADKLLNIRAKFSFDIPSDVMNSSEINELLSMRANRYLHEDKIMSILSNIFSNPERSDEYKRLTGVSKPNDFDNGDVSNTDKINALKESLDIYLNQYSRRVLSEIMAQGETNQRDLRSMQILNSLPGLISRPIYGSSSYFSDVNAVIKEIKSGDVYHIMRMLGFNITRETFNRAIDESALQGGSFENSNASIIINRIIDIVDTVKSKLDDNLISANLGSNIFRFSLEADPDQKSALGRIYKDYEVISSCLSESFEGVVQSGAYSAGKMRYTYVNPSYIVNFMEKLNGDDPSISQADFIEKQFGKDQFKIERFIGTTSKDKSIWINKWLSDIQKEKTKIGHTQMITFNGVAYKEMTGPQYQTSLFSMYFNCSDEDYAYFRVPIMSNKPSAEFIKFKKYSIDEIIDSSILIYDQEIIRIIHALKAAKNFVFKKSNGEFEFKMNRARDFFDVDFENLANTNLLEKIYKYSHDKEVEFTNNDILELMTLTSKDGNKAATEFKTLEFLNKFLKEAVKDPNSAEDEDKQTILNANTVLNNITESVNRRGVVEDINGDSNDIIKREFKKYMDSKYEKQLDEWINSGIFTPVVNLDESNKKIIITFPYVGNIANPIVINYNTEEGYLTDFNTINILKALGFNVDYSSEDCDIRLPENVDSKDHKFNYDRLNLDLLVNKSYGNSTKKLLKERINDVIKNGYLDTLLETSELSYDNTTEENVDYIETNNIYRERSESNTVGLGFEKLFDYFYNDWFATYNIINLTSSDVAFFQNYVDFQKRNAQQHAPSVKLDKFAKYKSGNEYKRVSDGVIRQVIIEDFNGKEFGSEVVNVIKSIFEQKKQELADRLNEDHADGADVILSSYQDKIDWIIDQFQNHIDLTDGQSYTSPTGYRKKMISSGKWSDEHEAAYKRITGKSDTKYKDYFSEISDIKLLCQPLKPFVYDQIDDNGMNVPFQVKNSEYMLFLASVIAEGNNSYNKDKDKIDGGKPNLLEVLYKLMERSNNLNEGGEVSGIDTIAFHSCVKVGASHVLDVKPKYIKEKDRFETTDEIIERIESDLYEQKEVQIGDRIETVNVYNNDFVQHIDMDNYGIQQEVPAHYADHWQQMSSQSRILVTADAPEKYTVWNGSSFEEIDATTAIDKYKQNVAAKIAFSIKSLRNELGIHKNLGNKEKMIEFRRKISKILLDSIGTNEKYSSDLEDAVSLNIEGEFRRNLNDEAISSRVQQLINAYIRKKVNKTAMSGGPIVQVSCFGMSEKLHVRFRGKDGSIMLSKSEFDSKYNSSSPMHVEWEENGIAKSADYKTFEDYSKGFTHSLAYLEAYASLPSENIAKMLTVKDKNGKEHILNYQEAVERGILDEETADRLSKILGVRIPTEDAYSMLPIKVIGFLPAYAGEGIVLPKEVTELTGSDFDIDKIFATNYNIAYDLNTRISSGHKSMIGNQFVKYIHDSFTNSNNNNAHRMFDDNNNDVNFNSAVKLFFESYYGEEIGSINPLILLEDLANDMFTKKLDKFDNSVSKYLSNLENRSQIKKMIRYAAINKEVEDINAFMSANRLIIDAISDAILKYKYSLFMDATSLNMKNEKKIDNDIFDFQWMALTDKSTLPKTLNPGNFVPQKKIARIKTVKLTCDPSDSEFIAKYKEIMKDHGINPSEIKTQDTPVSQSDLEKMSFADLKKMFHNINGSTFEEGIQGTSFSNTKKDCITLLLGFTPEALADEYYHTDASGSRYGKSKPIIINYNHLQKLSIKELDKLLSTNTNDNHNILFCGSQIYFFEQNMSAAKLIGTFANHNIAHTILQRQNITYHSESVSKFSIGGHKVGDGTKFDAIYDSSGEYISKNIAGFLAASVDAAKDPVLNFLNLNSTTVTPMMTLIRLGFDVNTASLFMSQDIITRVINEFNLEQANGGTANVSKVITRLIYDILMDNGISYNKVKDEIANRKKNLSEDISIDDMFEAINNSTGKVGNVSIDDYNVKVLLLFQHLISLSKDVKDMTEQCRFNSMAYAVGPNIYDTQSRRNSINKFYERCSNTDEGSRDYEPVNFLINRKKGQKIVFTGFNGIPLAYDPDINDQKIISNDPILSAYYYYIYGSYTKNKGSIFTVGADKSFYEQYGLEREIMSSLGFIEYSPIYEKLIDKFESVSKYGLDDNEMKRIKGEFIYYLLSKSFDSKDPVTKAYVHHDSGFKLSQSERAELLKTFPEYWNKVVEKAKFNNFSDPNVNYALNVLSKYFEVEDSNSYHDFEVLNIVSVNLKPEAVEDFKNALNTLAMSTDGGVIAKTLFKYTMLRSGGHFDKLSAFHLISTEFIETIPEYNYALNHLEDIMNESDIDNFFNQYIRNHHSNDDYRIVRDVYAGLLNAFCEIDNIEYIHPDDEFSDITITFSNATKKGTLNAFNLPISTNSTLVDYTGLSDNSDAYKHSLEICPYIKYNGRLYRLNNDKINIGPNTGSAAVVYTPVSSLGENNLFVEYDAELTRYMPSLFSRRTGTTRSFSFDLAFKIYDLEMEKRYDNILNGVETILYSESEGEYDDYTEYFLNMIGSLVGITDHYTIINMFDVFKNNILNNNEYRAELRTLLLEWKEQRDKVC